MSERILNINVGVLGHVDSGKTSLARAISTLISTAALDKNPQSQERGITLDLGFSALQVDLPHHLRSMPYDKLQITLVDCPGHASLIRTIIGGAQIIDIMLLVVDVIKGFQTQTAECLIVGEISPTKDMIVVLNKIDLIPEKDRLQHIDKMKKRIRATLKSTKFSDCSMVAISAQPGGEQSTMAAEGLDVLIAELTGRLKESSLQRDGGQPFLFAIDHCFPIRGQGSVMTGTVLQGRVSVNQTIEIPALKLQRKVKSMQMFHSPVTEASQGDRIGICVTQLDPKLIERGIAAAPGSVATMKASLATVKRIRFFKGRIGGKTKFHVTVGHSTVMAEALFFGLPKSAISTSASSDVEFDFSREYAHQEELQSNDERNTSLDGLSCSDAPQWALLTFESPITCPWGALMIASRLDTDIHSSSCRLAFHGRLLAAMDPGEKDYLQSLKVFKMKSRAGIVDRVVDSNSVICRGLFKKDADISHFLGLKVVSSLGDGGVIASSFGKSGKVKITFSEALKEPLEMTKQGSNEIILSFKRYIFDSQKRMIQ